MSSRASQRSSTSPFRSRKSPGPPLAKGGGGGRPTTPSSVSSVRPMTPSSASSTSVRSAALLGNDVSLCDPDDRPEFSKSKENVTVTVRFRPLSMREINKGDEVAWYADGDYIVRNEYNPSIAYGFDRVFGPATTTLHVYDVAAQHVVNDAMEGINGIVFAYGVTSSGKTHTMHGDQKSPGIIPLAVKDVFSIIQETPGREYLLRVSYLEIYNEVINDLLDPTGQNLRIREDAQGTYVEGIKEEVILSPAHALSLIASGEEHRHVGSNNFNLLSSRSHTIFTLTIESSPSGESSGDEDVRLSQLNLIDLAGSESSKTETTGVRRKEGSFINKSLLTLGTVISKLTDGKASHIPYRDSKLTRLLQSSLSGHGKISLICTVTPASSNIEETHNTLKFAHRSKHVEIKAAQNKILDEKSLIKKYQREISSLKEELQQLRRGMMERSYMIGSDQEDLVTLKLQLEAGKIKLQSRLEEEEQAKAALMGRIQRLTKLILVSTKNTMPSSTSGKIVHRRRHSFGEDELAYLPDRSRDYVHDDDVGSLDSEFSAEGKLYSSSLGEPMKFDKRNKMHGMLGWLKIKKLNSLSGLTSGGDNESSASGSPSFSQASQPKCLVADTNDGRRKSVNKKEDLSALVDSIPERTQAGDLFTVSSRGQRPLSTGMTTTDQMDLLCEQVKMLAGEVALRTSSLKRLQEQAIDNAEDPYFQERIRKTKSEINEKKSQMRLLEQRMLESSDMIPSSPRSQETSQALSKLASQLNEKMFELEIMSADNRILQEQLQLKVSENAEIRETVLQLRHQLNFLSSKENSEGADEPPLNENAYSTEDQKNSIISSSLKTQLLKLVAENENLKQENARFADEKEGLEVECQKLAGEASYAKELAAAAAVELRNLAEEVTKLSYQNSKLMAELENEASLESALAEQQQKTAGLQRIIDEGKLREQNLENELASTWMLVSELKRNDTRSEVLSDWLHENDLNSKRNGFVSSNGNYDSTGHMEKHIENLDGIDAVDELRSAYDAEKNRCQELKGVISRLKGEDLSGLDASGLEELQNFHVEALSRICQEKLTNRVM